MVERVFGQDECGRIGAIPNQLIGEESIELLPGLYGLLEVKASSPNFNHQTKIKLERMRKPLL